MKPLTKSMICSLIDVDCEKCRPVRRSHIPIEDVTDSLLWFENKLVGHISRLDIPGNQKLKFLDKVLLDYHNGFNPLIPKGGTKK